ncbi:MAG TPA: alpha/beta fold hydrolase [Burkholderiaceae bacterium]|nr:alpha/beta fold hydrolase [Burkholderiaceae bacterium]HMX09785.1 alpha/beta fold hydrolase [Burkholderiaceae bacterium]HMY98642.1 alpha/beta fold hydrolase [Burkholderiaceae bacterium]HNB43590.1 alpha/beta fold hydrolase [Burkholderiaceae bacterium]HNG78366.1 alpha/beta fold hydrolase [Burkholderiaceae bacterium]
MTPTSPRWLPGGHAQTIWAAKLSRSHLGPPPRYRRERWTTPDGDFVDADWLADPVGSASGAATAGTERPLLALFHGLEGSSRSHYALAFADWARRHGWAYAVPHFRGCSGELNRAPRAYHSGDHVEVGWMLAQLRARHHGPIAAVGVSLGGNALLRWAQEAGDAAGRSVQAVAALCSPIDLMASGRCIGEGLNRWIYTPMFLRTMKPKALAKLAQHPGLFDADRLRAARTIEAFDDAFTAPLHGFRGVQDYWRRASALPQLHRLRLPTLLLNTGNDPFVPAASLPDPAASDERLTIWRPASGGHVGFPGGPFPAQVLGLPQAVMGWMTSRMALPMSGGPAASPR